LKELRDCDIEMGLTNTKALDLILSDMKQKPLTTEQLSLLAAPAKGKSKR
jgi:hypothetical protein